ncbi:hypothetical protein B0181_07125 [Moraxella caviae]|uniref:Zn-ribbon-containing, possibly RNA-binding protein and truncated derivatives n=1 Tax=Moraxella caviae TaxID=34060 RepID=A0A1T0A0Y8_9GAMM|nr:hypothetical protein [Moraxella caviae]OOR89443.1 hypothetical protein B0181_07125 [Moraxella caviae]STZ09834.1 Uncharacterised protein [Moraxella caviae]
MTDFTKPDLTTARPIDDLAAKTHTTNFLAAPTEKLAAAGAKPPKNLAARYQYLQACTKKVRQALHALVTPDVLDGCHVVYADAHRMTLSLFSATAANHLRYVSMNCVQALRAYDQQFCDLQEIRVIATPPAQSVSRQNSSQKTLSENTKRIINQNANNVIKHDGLRQALLRLANDDGDTKV